MQFNIQRLAKLSLIFFGLLFIVCLLLGRRERETEILPLEGEKITVEDVEILLDALGVSFSMSESGENAESQTALEAGPKEKAAYFTYGQYEALCGQIGKEEWNLPDYKENYQSDQALLKEDWYKAFRIFLAYLDPESSIWETTVFVLKVDSEAGEAYTENGALQGACRYCSTAFAGNELQEMKVYVKGDTLLTIVEVLPEDHYLGSVWVMETTDGEVDCFYHQTMFHASVSEEETLQLPEREQIADLTFRGGYIVEAEEHREKVHGKLLRASSEELEIEDYGIYPLAQQMEVYKLYGSLETLTRADLRVGYADTDFVVEKGKIVACLVSEAAGADQIRVLLKNTASGSNFHENVDIRVDGEETKLRMEQMAVGERRIYRSANLTDKVTVEMEGSTRENHAYRGAVECLRMEQGIAVVNELPLEEYLYAVVPSEMPASYPEEALKAQAVCARTYAYRYILRAGIPELGAHVDDTTAYQVYHNIGENAASTTAVKETDGMLLTYQGEAAGNYYYSTSCGAGTDVISWQGGNGEEISYLQGGRVSMAYEENDGFDAESLREEDTFRQFITKVHEEDLEREEPWYRWTYHVEELDEEAMVTRLRERQEKAPACVLTKADGDYYVSEPVKKPGKIKKIEITKRGAGGIAQELTIEAEKGTFKVLSEYNIRYVLCDGKSAVRKQDDSETVPGTLLPSGFFVLDPVFTTGKGGENVVGYTLVGGGFGHGVGMSQNGAKALGSNGVSYGQILMQFYPGCELTDSETLKEQ